MIDKIASMLGGTDLIKSQASKIKDVLEDMKTSDSVIEKLGELIQENSEERYTKESLIEEAKRYLPEVDNICINVFKVNGSVRINFSFDFFEKQYVYQKHTIKSLTKQNMMLGMFVPYVERMLDSVKVEKGVSEDEILVLTIANKLEQGEKKPVIRFTNMTTQEVYSEEDFFTILGTID